MGHPVRLYCGAEKFDAIVHFVALSLHYEVFEKLLFQVIICPKLQELLYFMHAFLTAKVASVDPAFMSRGNSAGRVT